jgi:hypothetical protein
MLSAINPAIEYGIYSVNVEYGPMGIEIDERKATVRGETTPDLAESCTAFACLLSGIECPNNLLYARGITGTADAFRIVLDDGASTASVGAYTEMVGALSYLQAKRADVDKNGMVDEIETAANRFYIMPYLNSNGSCRLQPMTSLLQNNNGSNKSIDCSLIRGVHIRESVENTIEVTNDDRIILSGDLDHLLIEAIIVGNVVAPEWISALHGVR